jgi:HPt (histidine-containing phosphotransfer) domain-containing protein
MKTINWERVSTFADMNDPEDLEWLRETAKDLVISMDDKINLINNLLNNPDKEALLSICHQVKGVSSNFGLDAIYEISLNAEKKLKTDSWEDSLSLLKSLDEVWKQSSRELTLILKI